MERLLDDYVDREIECIYQSIELWDDKILLSLKNKILPLVCEQSRLHFYKTRLEEAEREYDDAVVEQEKEHKAQKEKDSGSYNELLRVLDHRKYDLQHRMEEPFYEKIFEWRAKRCLFLERHTEPHQRQSVCIEYSYCKNNTSQYRTRVKYYQERRKEYETTGKVFPNLTWLLEYEKEVLPWGFPDRVYESILYTSPIVSIG